MSEVVLQLQSEPDMRRRVERAFELQRGLGGDRLLALDDLVHDPSGPWHRGRERLLREPSRGELLGEQATGVHVSVGRGCWDDAALSHD